MISRSQSQYIRPLSAEVFEDMITDTCRLEWGDAESARYGRSGQKQDGVDVFGKPFQENQKVYRGAQCKLRTTDKLLSDAELQKEVLRSRKWPNKMGHLDQLIIATDHPRDTNVQQEIERLNNQEIELRGMKVSIWFWEDIWERLITQPKLMLKYYADHISQLTNVESAKLLIDTPLTIHFQSSVNQNLSKRLRLRGIRISKSAARFDGALIFALEDFEIQQVVINASFHLNRYQPNYPVVIVISDLHHSELAKSLRDANCDLTRLHLLSHDKSLNDLGDKIFSIVFDSGYHNRAELPTLEILARNSPNQSESAILDLDWSYLFHNDSYPTLDEWGEYYSTAQKCLASKLTSLKDGTRLQIDSRLKLPAAFSLGFHLNTRNSTVGVWNRQQAQSGFKANYWFSDGEILDIEFPIMEIDGNAENRSAVLEISTNRSIHSDVSEFVSRENIQVCSFFSCRMFSEEKSIDDATYARSFADFIGRYCRKIRSEQGIVDFHVFLNIPSALGVLVGRNFLSCGRLHLYWYDNPTYRYAFLLR